MSDTTQKYRVLKAFRGDKQHNENDVVELSDAQAQYLVLNGKIELADKASTKPANQTGASHKPENK